jgi:hypothetical protein
VFGFDYQNYLIAKPATANHIKSAVMITVGTGKNAKSMNQTKINGIAIITYPKNFIWFPFALTTLIQYAPE